MSKYLKVILITLIPIISNHSILAQSEEFPEKLIKTNSIDGYFLGIQEGDFIHAIIETIDRDTVSFFLSHPLATFLILNKNSILKINYDVIETFIEDAGDYVIIDRINSASTDSISFDDWYNELKLDSLKLDNMINKYFDELYKANIIEY